MASPRTNIGADAHKGYIAVTQVMDSSSLRADCGEYNQLTTSSRPSRSRYGSGEMLGMGKTGDPPRARMTVTKTTRETRDVSNRRNSAISRLLWTLWLFVVFGMLCATSAAVLFWMDIKFQGFSVVHSTGVITYLWKFGPTAVFTIALALWRQVDYEIKLTVPWEEMAKGYADASKSMLLDYLSPILPTAFTRAVRNRHWSVVASISVFAFVKLAALFSTGLLILQPVHVVETRLIQLEVPKVKNLASWIRSSQSIVNEYVAGTILHLPWLKGSSNLAAFQEISNDNHGLPLRGTISATVLAVYPWLQCEPGDAYSWFDDEDDSTSEDSSIETRYTRTPAYMITTHLHYKTEHTEATVTLDAPLCEAVETTCPESIILAQMDEVLSSGIDNTTDDWQDVYRFIIYELASRPVSAEEAEQAQSTGTSNTTVFSGVNWQQYISWASVLVCEAGYAIETGNLTSKWPLTSGPSSSAKISTNITNTGRQFPVYSSTELTSEIMDLVTDTVGYTAAVLKTGSRTNNTFLDLMLATGNVSDLSVFQNPLLMVEPAQSVFQGLASLYLKPWVTFPEHASTNATVEFQAARLRVSHLPFWLMEGCLACFCIGVVVLIRNVQLLDFPFRSLNLFQDALIVASSSKTLPFLRSLGPSPSENELSRSTRNMKFGLHSSPSTLPRIESKTASRTEALPKRQAQKPGRPSDWSLLSMRWWYLILSIVLSILVIIALELIQKRADMAGGGFAVAIPRSHVTYISSFVAASVMLSISMMYDGSDFVVAGLAPYLLLYRKPVSLQGMGANPLQQLPPVAIFNQLRVGQPGVALVMLAALFGSTLNMIASGLYSVETYTEVYDGFANTIETFDFGADLSLRRTGQANFASIQRTNASFPLGTGDEFAFPLFTIPASQRKGAPEIQNADEEEDESWGSAQIEVPVLRMSLNCTRILASELTLRLYDNDTLRWPLPSSPTLISSRSSLPAHCMHQSPVYGESEEYEVDSTAYLTLGSTNYTQTGAETERVRAVVNGSVVSPSVEPVRYPPSCPSVAFTIGSWIPGVAGSDTITRVVCSEYMEIIPATLTFTLPGRELDWTHPPLLHTERASITDRLNWTFTDLFRQDSDSHRRELDTFYWNVVHGVQGVPLTEMIGDDNYERFLNVTQRLYRVFMAQVIGNDMRVTSDGSGGDNSYPPVGTRLNATISSNRGIRIQQDRQVKLALQVILGVMAAFLLLGCRDVRRCDGLLACNPFHILGRTSLLVDSEFVRQVNLGKDEVQLWQEHADVKLRLWRHPSVMDESRFGKTVTITAKESTEGRTGHNKPKKTPVVKTTQLDENLLSERPVSDLRWKPLPAPPTCEDLERACVTHRQDGEVAWSGTNGTKNGVSVERTDGHLLRRRTRWHVGIDLA